MKYKLFCLPYAGGSAMIYTPWKRMLNSYIELHPLEMAGRGRRIMDQPLDCMEDVIEDLWSSVQGELDESEFALFGHSMGAHVAYELALSIKHHTGREPVHLFVSGTYPPHMNTDKLHPASSDKQLIKEIKELGGLPEEALQCEELMQLFLPVIRKDLQVMNRYQPQVGSPINCDMSVLYAEDDVMTETCHIAEWSAYVSQRFKSYRFTGGHFFIMEHATDVTAIINETMRMPANLHYNRG
ncbi:thioesterase II family protein [Paenibacillus arenosi]|uniref:Thioesterase n=1 Tax=Paenibacillus arenosi TaxID=2774142 RepID=A0ABR9AS55_9BACL|nr:thioesterase [Paenibacillus arenosi]MBD8496936.1 thioesterase [Paenibacillus arenosi]